MSALLPWLFYWNARLWASEAPAGRIQGFFFIQEPMDHPRSPLRTRVVSHMAGCMLPAPSKVQSWMNRILPCMCETTAQWLLQKDHVRELLPYVSLTSLMWVRGKCLLFLDCWWPCRRAVFYTEGMPGAHQCSISPQFALQGALLPEEEKEFWKNRNLCVLIKLRFSSPLVLFSSHEGICWCPSTLLFPGCSLCFT